MSARYRTHQQEFFNTYGFSTIPMPGEESKMILVLDLVEGRDYEIISSTLHINPNDQNLQMEGNKPSRYKYDNISALHQGWGPEKDNMDW